MALTYSTMMELGTVAPDFKLTDTITGNEVSLHQLASDCATVIMFICNHCPYVKHILAKLVEKSQNYQKKGVKFIAISSNEIESYPEDSPQKMKELAINNQFTFPYLFDETQEIAKAYQAACTPDFYIFDKSLKCVYRGRFDDSTPGNNKPVTGKDLSEALDLLLNQNQVVEQQEPSMGCNIKWKEPV